VVDGEFALSSMLEHQIWTHLLSWMLQIMPMFFIVGGYSNGMSWKAATRDGKSYGEWLNGRLQRLAGPVLPLLAVWAMLGIGAYLMGARPETVKLGSRDIIRIRNTRKTTMAQQQEQQRIALITGGAKGIGAAIAEQLARGGMHVLIDDIDDAQAHAKADELVQNGFSASPLHIDVGKAASVTAAFHIIDEKWGRCDVVVNNAGIAKTCSFVDFPLDSWQAHLDLNVTGVLMCAQEGARRMMKQR
jgi:hypothetical protein